MDNVFTIEDVDGTGEIDTLTFHDDRFVLVMVNGSGTAETHTYPYTPNSYKEVQRLIDIEFYKHVDYDCPNAKQAHELLLKRCY